MNNDFFQNNKYLFISVLVALILIFFMGKSFGKSDPPKAIDIEGDTDTDGYFVSSLSDSDIRYLTERIYKDLDGVNWLVGADHENELWFEVSNLSDRDLTRVINEWSKTYYRKHNQTLGEMIDNDWFLDISDLITALLRRIQKIERY